MKKVLFVLLFLIPMIGLSQCYRSKRNYDRESKFGLIVNIGTLKSLGGEVYFKFNKHVISGGYAGEMNDYHREEYKNQTLFLTYGYQYKKYIFGLRCGKQNNAIWTDTDLTDNFNILNKVVTPYSVMVGGYVGYSLPNNVGINIGYDTFSQITIGLVMGI